MWSLKTLAVAAMLTLTSLVLTAWHAYTSGKQAGQQQVQSLWDKDKAATAEAIAQQQAQARAKEQAWQAKADKLQEARRHEIARLNSRHAAIVDSLRDRPERSSGGGVPEASQVGDGERACTGNQLYRPDASFLIGEAVRADQLRIALRACQAAYSAVSE